VFNLRRGGCFLVMTWLERRGNDGNRKNEVPLTLLDDSGNISLFHEEDGYSGAIYNRIIRSNEAQQRQ
jgi:hypothetical protein